VRAAGGRHVAELAELASVGADTHGDGPGEPDPGARPAD
jgi:hypothetical protein